MATHAAAALGGAAAAGLAVYLYLRRSRPASANPGRFILERYFAEYEFSAKHQICNSDVSSLSLKELLALCTDDKASLTVWRDLSLGYTESRGDPALLAEIASCYSSSITAQDVPEGVPAEGILFSAEALCQPGDEFFCVWPAYQSLFEIARARGARIIKWRARGGGKERLHFRIDDLAVLCGVASGRPKRSIKAIVINLCAACATGTQAHRELLRHSRCDAFGCRAGTARTTRRAPT